MQIVQIFPVNQQIHDIEALTADLEPGLDPVDLGRLEELGRLEGLEERLLGLRFRGALVQRIEDPVLEELLVADADLDGVLLRAALLEPGGNEGDVEGPARGAGFFVEGVRRPQKRDALSDLLVAELDGVQEGLEWELEGGEGFVVERGLGQNGGLLVVGNGVDDRVEVKGRQLGVLLLDVDARGEVVGVLRDAARQVVVEVRVGDFIFSA